MAILLRRLSKRATKKALPVGQTDSLAKPLVCTCNQQKRKQAQRASVLVDPYFHLAHPDYDELAAGWARFSLPLDDGSDARDDKVVVQIPLYEHHNKFLGGWQKVHAYSAQYVLTVVIESASHEDGHWIFNDLAEMHVVRCDLQLVSPAKAHTVRNIAPRQTIDLVKPEQWWIYAGKEKGGKVDSDVDPSLETRLDFEATTNLSRRT